MNSDRVYLARDYAELVVHRLTQLQVAIDRGDTLRAERHERDAQKFLAKLNALMGE